MKVRALLGFSTFMVAAATLAGVQVPGAFAVTSGPAAGTEQARPASQSAKSHVAGSNISAVAAPSWQTNNTVWALAVAKGVVYVGGSFTSVRPPADPAGQGEVARGYLAAFSASTGGLLSFNPSIDGPVTALAAAPDGQTLYVGGEFSHVGGTPRANLAAFSTSTGALASWAPAASGKVLTIAPSPDGSQIYIGGAFGVLDGQRRTYAGAVTTSGGLLPWQPSLNNAVTSIAVPADDSRVLVGGYFTQINGVTQNAIGSTNPATGASEKWAATVVPDDPPGCTSSVKDIVVSGSTAYISAEGTGGGCFDGDFAATASNGALVWENDCLGATQALAVIGDWLYKGSHAHDCAFAPGGFPQVSNASGTVVGHHLLDQSLTDGTLGHWTPDTNGNQLGPRVMATDGTQLFVGGDFTSVNRRLQQGFARFAAGPDPTRPGAPAAPRVVSTSKGADSVTVTAVSTSDVGTLSYRIYRDGRTTPIATLTATSWPWALPVLHYRDAGLRPGSRHTYEVAVSDGTSTSAKSPASAQVTVAARSPRLSYPRTVLRDHPSFLWRLDQASGNVVADSSPDRFPGIDEPGTSLGVPGPIAGVKNTATAFDGRRGLVTSKRKVTAPAAFSIEGWFKTTTSTGGLLAGFGSSQVRLSSSYDRHVYMMNDGQLVFGVSNGKPETIETPDVYNDGHWHYVVATFGPRANASSMALYVDGQLIGVKAIGSAPVYAGYWRVGSDNLNGWNLDPRRSNSQGTTEPNSYYFRGTIGDVAVYPYALSAARVALHYAANVLNH